MLSLAGLFTAALGLGLTLNQLRDRPLSIVYQSKSERLLASVDRLTFETPPPVNAQNVSSLPNRLNLVEFRALATAKTGIIADARPEIFHRLGHIPGAIALPRDDFENYYQRHQSLLEANRETPIILYCSGNSCEDSELVEKALKRLGYTKISVFPGGWAEWTQAGLPVERTQ